MSREKLLQEIVGFSETDLLCYRAPINADIGEELRLRQDAAFDPILEWVKDAYGATFSVTDSIMPIPQNAAAIAAVQKEFAAADDAQILVLAELCGALGSALLTLALWKSFITPEQTVAAARLEEQIHAERYGLDPVIEAKWAGLEKIMTRCAKILTDNALS